MYPTKNCAIRIWIIAALCLCIPLLLWAYASNPPIPYTGAPGDTGTCSACHTLHGLGQGNVAIAFSGGGATYKPGTAQTLTITVTDTNSTTTKAWGFEMTALEGSVATASTPGTFTQPSSNADVIASGNRKIGRAHV